jgi:hypothetical protein
MFIVQMPVQGRKGNNISSTVPYQNLYIVDMFL